MNSFFDAISSLVADMTPKTRSANAEYVVTAPTLQVLSPPVCWNWQPTAGSQIPFNQFNFCDTMPQNVLDKNYTAGDSFTTAYSSFLQLINLDTFPLDTLAKANIVINDEPSIPVYSPAPDGWVVIKNNAHLLQWSRIWNLSQTPINWLASISTQENKPTNIVFEDPGTKIQTSNGDIIPVNDESQMKITANAVGRVRVTPGKWYNSSLIRIAETDDNYLKVPANSIFGNSGIINSRIVEIIVAFNPTPYVVLKKTDVKNLNDSSFTNLSVGGFTFTNQPDLVSEKTVVVEDVEFILSSLNKEEVQLTTKTKTKLDIDNLFIVAVILEEFNAPA